jgi:hypothetical protein
VKRILFAAHANSSDLWFGDGLPWYQHHAYEITKQDPSQCLKLFP